MDMFGGMREAADLSDANGEHKPEVSQEAQSKFEKLMGDDKLTDVDDGAGEQDASEPEDSDAQDKFEKLFESTPPIINPDIVKDGQVFGQIGPDTGEWPQVGKELPGNNGGVDGRSVVPIDKDSWRGWADRDTSKPKDSDYQDKFEKLFEPTPTIIKSDAVKDGRVFGQTGPDTEDERSQMGAVKPKEEKPVEIREEKIPTGSFDKTETDKTNEVSEKKLPATPENNGHWEGDRGNSKWIPNGDYVPPEKKPEKPYSNPDNLTWKEIMDKYGIDGITFKDGFPDFSEISKGTVEIEGFETGGNSEKNRNFQKADIVMAEQRGCSPDDVKKWRQENNYTWHECEDKKTMMKVPNEVHANVKHDGGRSRKD